MYTEFISKCSEHKFKDTNISNKQVHSIMILLVTVDVW